MTTAPAAAAAAACHTFVPGQQRWGTGDHTDARREKRSEPSPFLLLADGSSPGVHTYRAALHADKHVPKRLDNERGGSRRIEGEAAAAVCRQAGRV